MTTGDFWENSPTSIDRGFRPDLLKYGLGSAPLAALGQMGIIEKVGKPFHGLPGMRNALWYGQPANDAGDLAVIATVSPREARASSSERKWYVGYVPLDAQRPESDKHMVDEYARFAEHTTVSPEAAIALAHVFLFGAEDTSGDQHNGPITA